MAGIVVCVLALTGCEKDDGLNCKVRGKVTYKDSPVGGGTITFHAADGTQAISEIGSDGTYEFPKLPEGTMTVTIETESINPNKETPEYKGGSGGGAASKYGMKSPKPSVKKGASYSPAPEGAGGGQNKNYVKIPAKYADKQKSGLTITVTKGDQEKDFPLTD
jgi:hypothetical protein